MKRILGIFLAVVMLALTMTSSLCMSVSAVKGKKGSAAWVSDNEIIDVVGMLEIMVGDQYGNLNLDAGVTRAQFVKMMISASVYKQSASKGISNSPYPDVRAGHWASAYVQTAADNGLVKGYLDGTFRPDKPVKLEEAVTVVLRLLGYTAEDLQGTYPAPQMAMYDQLVLSAKISAKQGDNITRRDCMYLVYNMLNSDKKDY